MEPTLPQDVEALRSAVLEGEGRLPPQTRHSVAARVAALSDPRQPASVHEAFPEALEKYLEKLALQAYEITDSDVAALLEAGFTEDQVFEITVSGAIGAGLARLVPALELLEEIPDAA